MNCKDFSDNYQALLADLDRWNIDLKDPAEAFKIFTVVISLLFENMEAQGKEASAFVQHLFSRYIKDGLKDATIDSTCKADTGESPPASLV